MWEALEGCRLKIVAAAEHMHRFENAVEGFLEPNLDIAIVWGQANPQRTKYVFRVERMRPYPVREWGIILGDAIHCYRSALDQLAYTFAKEPSQRTAFPISVTKKEWVTKAPAQYWSISPAVLRLIDRVQPYHRGNAAATHPLAVLRAFSNLDKHRGIPTIALIADEAEADVISTTGIERWDTINFKTGAVYKKGAVVAECKIVPDHTDTEPEMDVKIEAAFDVAFDDIPAIPNVRNRLVTDTIAGVGQYVAKIMGVVGDAWNETVTKLGVIDYDALSRPDDD
jgi:hypothetical protein